MLFIEVELSVLVAFFVWYKTEIQLLIHAEIMPWLPMLHTGSPSEIGRAAFCLIYNVILFLHLDVPHWLDIHFSWPVLPENAFNALLRSWTDHWPCQTCILYNILWGTNHRFLWFSWVIWQHGYIYHVWHICKQFVCSHFKLNCCLTWVYGADVSHVNLHSFHMIWLL